MTVYRREGTRAQRAESERLSARLVAARLVVESAGLQSLRDEVEVAERLAALEVQRVAEARRVLDRRVGVAEREILSIRHERAQAVRDWAVERWPDSVELGRERLATATREAHQYSMAHEGTPRTRTRHSKVLAGAE